MLLIALHALSPGVLIPNRPYTVQKQKFKRSGQLFPGVVIEHRSSQYTKKERIILKSVCCGITCKCTLWNAACLKFATKIPLIRRSYAIWLNSLVTETVFSPVVACDQNYFANKINMIKARCASIDMTPRPNG